MADTRKLAAWAAGPTIFERHIREADVSETKLSNLEYGRAWCKALAISPRKSIGPNPRWGWYAVGLPPIVFDHLDRLEYASPAAAFAAVGRTVRRIHAAVPPLPPGG